MLNGKLTHRKTINLKYGTSDIEWPRTQMTFSRVVMRGSQNSMKTDSEVSSRLHVPRPLGV